MYRGANRKWGSRSRTSGSPPYFHFRFDRWRPADARFRRISARSAGARLRGARRSVRRVEVVRRCARRLLAHMVFECWGSAPNWGRYGRYGSLKIGVFGLKIGIFANFDPLYPENRWSHFRFLDAFRENSWPSVDTGN